jgi:hypothetical protein
MKAGSTTGLGRFLRTAAIGGLHKDSAAYWFLLTLLVSVAVLVVTWLGSPYEFHSDSEYYIAIAEGRVHDVIRPFSNRILHPIVVDTMGILHLSTRRSFLVVGILSLAILVATVSYVARSALPYPAIAALLATPFLLSLFRDYYLPDIFHAALLGLFFLCLFQNKLWLALALLFLLYITRETTILLGAALVFVSLHRRQWRVALGSTIISALGLSAISYAASLGQPNVHAINGLVYVMAKVPYNFLKNVVGLVLWTNTLASSFSREPLFVLRVPAWLPSGAIDSVGFYGFAPSYPLATATLLLATFGVLPSLVLADLASIRRRLFDESSLCISVALLYGLLAFVIGTSIGDSVGRLIGYGWPCFWVAFPFILQQYHRTDRKVLLLILSCYILASWVPFLLASARINSLPLSIAVLCFLLALHGFALKQTLRSRIDTTTTAKATLPARGVP